MIFYFVKSSWYYLVPLKISQNVMLELPGVSLQHMHFRGWVTPPVSKPPWGDQRERNLQAASLDGVFPDLSVPTWNNWQGSFANLEDTQKLQDLCAICTEALCLRAISMPIVCPSSPTTMALHGQGCLRVTTLKRWFPMIQGHLRTGYCARIS